MWLGLEKDFVNNDDIDEFLPLPNNYISDNANLLSERKSCDHESGLKDHGKEIIEFCKMSAFRIANGRLGKVYILTGTEDMTHGYCISSRVLRI